MKRIMSFAAILLLLVNLAACSAGTGSGTKAETKTVSYGTAGAASSGDDKPTISIYYLMNSDYVTNAIQEFKSTFGDVNVVQKFYYLKSIDKAENEDYTESISTEILTGGGPDVIVCQPLNDIDSISKMFSSGAFADLNDFISKDKEFKLDDYNKNVMDAGVINGRREFVPIYYARQFFYTTDTVLKQNNININDNCSFADFSKAIDAFLKNQNRKSKYLMNSDFNFLYLMNLYGENFLDYDNKKSNFNSSEFKELLRLYKKIKPLIATDEAEKKYDYYPAKLVKNNFIAFEFDRQGSLNNLNLENGRFNYLDKDKNGEMKLIKISCADKAGNLKPIITNIAAINNNSKNKQYAYEFIKILLSERIQRQMYSDNIGGFNTCNNPVSYSAFKKDLDKYTTNFKTGVSIGMGTEIFDSIPLSDILIKKITDINNNMDKPIFMDKAVRIIIEDALKDYLSGKKDENQTAQLINDKVELFLNE